MKFVVHLCFAVTFAFILDICECFLLNSTSVGGKTDDKYYRLLLEFLADERDTKQQLLQVQQQQKQMETSLLGLQQDLKACQNTDSVAICNNSTELTQLQEDYASLYFKINQLEKENTELRLNNSNLSVEVKEISEKVEKLSKKVILTSCISHTKTYFGGQIIPFLLIKTSYGVTNLGDFQNTGKFKCAEEGTYIISVYIMSYSASEYLIYKNSVILSRVIIVGQPNNITDYHTGSATLAVDLDVGDALYVKAYQDMYIYGGYACQTLIKIR